VHDDEAPGRRDAADAPLVRAEQLARRAGEAAVEEPRAGRVDACVRERRPQVPRVGGEGGGAMERVGRQRVLVGEPFRAQRLEARRVAPGPRSLPGVEDGVDLHPGHHGVS
jgi:hypothetical protein